MAKKVSVPYEAIVNASRIGKSGKGGATLNEVISAGLKENLRTSVNDTIRRLFLVIDPQQDFMEGGALGVTGSHGDVERITHFIYDNAEGLTTVMCSLDTHQVFHVFHRSMWRNANGEMPNEYETITYEDILNGKWHAVWGDIPTVNKYVQKLEELSKKTLVTWPYHCLEGTEGQSFENEFAKMLYFHAAAKKYKVPIIHKGTDPYSERYGIIRAEYDPSNKKEKNVLEAMTKYNEIYVAGEAASHCLLESVAQIADEYANRPDVTSKITILKDCTSPITGFEDVTQKAFEMFEKQYGIKFANSTDIHF
jgi:nicotinamidase-related amidase